MTPKEKARELYEKFSGFIPQKSWASKNYSAMECALIVIDELIKETGSKYWYEVKKEIINL